MFRKGKLINHKKLRKNNKKIYFKFYIKKN